MSINSLANAAAARRPDTFPLGTFPKGLDEIARASAISPVRMKGPARGAAITTQPSSAVDTAFNVLFGYIPTEILTLYIAVLAAIQHSNKVTSAQWTSFWCFLVATPIVVWLVYGAKVKALQKPLPLKFGSWPIWEMFAATTAYSAWALALPNTPFAQYEWYSSALSGVVVLVASTVLGLLAPFFQRSLSA
jgi:hypothetical protein